MANTEDTKLSENLQIALAKYSLTINWSINMPVIVINPVDILAVTQILKNELNFDMFLDVTAVDWLAEKPERFEVVYHFYSTKILKRVRVKANLPENNPSIDSLKPLYGSSYFMERECHEMYGINFIGNNDLRPILLYEGFVGHPLRKDYHKKAEQPIVPYINDFSIKN